jgi:hypothetical protein
MFTIAGRKVRVGQKLPDFLKKSKGIPLFLYIVPRGNRLYFYLNLYPILGATLFH